MNTAACVTFSHFDPSLIFVNETKAWTSGGLTELHSKLQCKLKLSSSVETTYKTEQSLLQILEVSLCRNKINVFAY